MTKEEILHLAELARIDLEEEEGAILAGNITQILEYVSTIQSIAGDELEKELTPRYNVFREDVATDAPGKYTDAILAQAPKRHGQYVEVKKILSQDE